MDEFDLSLMLKLTKRDVESEYWRNFVINRAKQENWFEIYLLSECVSREVSILVDNNDNYWVDWGTIGSVNLSPPIGAVLPFKLWVHTHPSNTAYWSLTDRNSLELAKGIIEEALVLGMNGILSTKLESICPQTDIKDLKNLCWSENEVISWFDFYEIDFREYYRVYRTRQNKIFGEISFDKFEFRPSGYI